MTRPSQHETFSEDQRIEIIQRLGGLMQMLDALSVTVEEMLLDIDTPEMAQIRSVTTSILNSVRQKR